MEDVGEYEGSKEQSKGGLNDLVVEWLIAGIRGKGKLARKTGGDS
jgi:hypothetical protein